MKFIVPLIFFISCFAPAVMIGQQLPVGTTQIKGDSDLVTDTSTSITHVEVKPFEYQIYPAQVKSKLQIILPASENFTMRLVDEQGNVLLSHFQIFGENQLNLGHLKAAKYFVEISSPKGKVIEEITKT
ncbi:MAG: T9SS type A sorting domain-containing protein [Saprospiraceae bacterium]|nr:T9SS type A sorting domain-containing protein [Saprospiraceae bacterium]